MRNTKKTYNPLLILVIFIIVIFLANNLSKPKITGELSATSRDSQEKQCCQCPPPKTITQSAAGTSSTAENALTNCCSNTIPASTAEGGECYKYCKETGPEACYCCEPSSSPITGPPGKCVLTNADPVTGLPPFQNNQYSATCERKLRCACRCSCVSAAPVG